MNDIQNKVITITSVETKSTTSGKVMLKIKDQKNLSYQIWKNKQDGSESVAYQGYEKLGEPVGQNVEIAFKEDTGDYNGKQVTYRTIVAVKPTGQPVSQGNTMVKSQMAEASKKSDDEKWEKINQEKEKSMRWMNALNNATLLVANGKIEFKDLKHHANLIYQMRPLDTQEPKQEPIKAEDLGEVMEDELRADQIPF
jgi:hypothetical protein